jgi:2-polyprenyl-3-methyl-5-hydroxy-6-metoxy-1,4-benzoquinol methylase
MAVVTHPNFDAPRPGAGESLKFTGERIVPGRTAEALFREHEQRYVFAGQYVSGKNVLDIACGTGVGTSFLLRNGATRVWGFDIDAEAVAFAKAKYPDCEFGQCDATALNLLLEDASLDVVVSFETLEHLKPQREFLLACRRVLKPGGLLICSTPNLGVSRWSASNPYHVREFHPEEFRDLLESMFASVELFSQTNRALLSYAPRKLLRRALDAVHLTGGVERLLGRRPPGESLREDFINDIPALNGSISKYQRSFLNQPTFLLAVARKAADDAE